MDGLHLPDEVVDVLGPTLLACEAGSRRSRRGRDARGGGSAVRGARREGEYERDDKAERSSSHPGRPFPLAMLRSRSTYYEFVRYRATVSTVAARRSSPPRVD